MCMPPEVYMAVRFIGCMIIIRTQRTADHERHHLLSSVIVVVECAVTHGASLGDTMLIDLGYVPSLRSTKAKRNI